MTKTDFDSKYSPIVMPEPFAESGSKTLPANTQNDASGFSFPLGFSGSYSSPKSKNGKYVTRAQMNAIGNLATHNDFYRRCGGLNTFDSVFADKIGGYPSGAVLDYIIGDKLFKIMSMIDNNMVAPSDQSIDGGTWIFMNQDVPTPGASLVASFSGSPVESFVVNETNVLYTGVSFLPISAFRATRDAIVYLGNINFAQQQVLPYTPYTGISAMDVISGWGIFFKDLGPSNSSIESIPSPTYDNLNGWKQMVGVGDLMGSRRLDSTNYWTATFSVPRVMTGNYYAIGIFVGCSVYSKTGTTAYQINRRVTGADGDGSNFSFDLFYR